jgi:hypothetical protein
MVRQEQELHQLDGLHGFAVDMKDLDGLGQIQQ